MHELTGREEGEGRAKVLCQKRKHGNENIALVEIARRLCSVTLHLPEDGFKPAIYFLSDLQSKLVKQLEIEINPLTLLYVLLNR